MTVTAFIRGFKKLYGGAVKNTALVLATYLGGAIFIIGFIVPLGYFWVSGVYYYLARTALNQINEPVLVLSLSVFIILGAAVGYVTLLLGIIKYRRVAGSISAWKRAVQQWFSDTAEAGRSKS